MGGTIKGTLCTLNENFAWYALDSLVGWLLPCIHCKVVSWVQKFMCAPNIGDPITRNGGISPQILKDGMYRYNNKKYVKNKWLCNRLNCEPTSQGASEECDVVCTVARQVFKMSWARWIQLLWFPACKCYRGYSPFHVVRSKEYPRDLINGNGPWDVSFRSVLFLDGFFCARLGNLLAQIRMAITATRPLSARLLGGRFPAQWRE